MAASEHNQPICRREDALHIVQTLQQAAHIAYFAGGCVRDMLWNLTPKDFDVATDAPPARVRELFPRSQGVGQAFGVVLVRQGKSMIEVATFRADGSYSDGRRPDDIRFATPEEDAQRRDFTINGLFFDPVSETVIDFVQGQADLATRTLRAIGDPSKRFAEDYLRLLRAVRFASRFDLTLDAQTEAAIRANVHKLPRIAPERIADELRAMLGTTYRDRAHALLDRLDLLPVLFRHVLASTATLGTDVGVFAKLMPGQKVDFATALATLATDTLLRAGGSLDTILAPASVAELVQRLRQSFRLSNEDCTALTTIFATGALLAGEMPSVAQLKRFLAREHAPSARQFLAALRAAGFNAARIDAIDALAATFAPDSIAPPPLIDGTDLQALGHAPGPAFKRVLDTTYDAQLESRIISKADAITLAQSLFADKPD